MDPGKLTRSAILISISILAFPFPAPGAEKPKSSKPDPKEKLYQSLLKAVAASPQLPKGWMVETESYIVHTTISREYTAAAAAHLHRFWGVFRSIFQGDFKEPKKPVAYAFATEKEYLRFSPDCYGTQGRFQPKPGEKNLAWFSTPPGEKDFYRTDITVVQHEAAHQLLDAYTGNSAIPSWFQEGVATFFESWDLEKKTPENILSGVSGDRGLGICLSYPAQTPPPPLSKHWIPARDVLSILRFKRIERPSRWPPPAEDRVQSFLTRLPVIQEYNQCWCAMAFFIDHKKGQEIFKLFVKEFREGKSFEAIRKRYYDETFLGSFEKEWKKFIETKVIARWKLPAAGGKAHVPGDGRPPPEDARGFALTRDRRGDAFLVDAEARTLDLAGKKEEVWMLRAWSVPLKLYEEAWGSVPGALSRGWASLVGGAYELRALVRKEGQPFKAFFLFPAWVALPDDGSLPEKAGKAAAELISKARASPPATETSPPKRGKKA